MTKTKGPGEAKTPGGIPISGSPPATPGRLLFYRYREEDGCCASVVGEQRPCIVVRRWPGEFEGDVDGYNVQVFVDGTNDFEGGSPTGGHLFWAKSVKLGDGPGEISWPHRA